MANIKIDLSDKKGRIKPMHGGGQPPLSGERFSEAFHYLTEAGIPFSRLHDVGGAFGAGKFVDIPNIFRNFDADENDPENYDFVFTDILVAELIKAGVEPYYRLGTTIENHAFIKAYYTVPPKDYKKWARICGNIIAHYNEGWADGFRYGIRYWEIWNEPDVQRQMMWNGTPEEFYRLYEVTAKHLKGRFGDSIKVGGYASCGFYAIAPDDNNTPPSDHEENLMSFFYGFFDHIKKSGAPIDFFSWHSYANAKRMLVADRWLHETLIEYGYGDIETHLNEWNPNFGSGYGTAEHTAQIAATMLGMQNGYADVLCIYDMRMNTVPWSVLFDVKTSKPIQGYYALAAFNRLYRLGDQVRLDCDTEGVYAVCASDGRRGAMMLANISGSRQEIKIEGVSLEDARCYVIDDTRLMSWAPNLDAAENNEVWLIEFDCS